MLLGMGVFKIVAHKNSFVFKTPWIGVGGEVKDVTILNAPLVIVLFISKAVHILSTKN